jgi:hypothetical protein
MKLFGLKTVSGFFLAAILSAPAFGTRTALPGTLNYVEGTAQIGSQSLNGQSVGTTALQAGQTISTGTGRAEVLLTPGVFVRLDQNASLKMISPSLTHTKVELEKGRAAVEIDEIHTQNDIEVLAGGATAKLLKNGLYEFDADNPDVRVFDGKATIYEQDKSIDLKGGRELSLKSDAPFKAQKFDKKHAGDDFYSWSSLRSQYEAEANADAAVLVPTGYGSGWFWDPYFSAYTFIPGNGIFYSPFGYGFSSPYYFGAPYRFYGGGYYRGGYYGHDIDAHSRYGYIHDHDGGFHGSGMHSGSGFHDGGGFHGGGGHR